MNNSAMAKHSGATPATPTEELFSQVQIRLIVSRRERIAPQIWRLNVQSPFWRLYVHDRAGAMITYANEIIELRPGRMYLIPAWLHFESSLSQEVTQDYLHFILTGFPRMLTKEVFNQPIEILASSSRIRSLVREWRKGLNEAGTNLANLLWAHALVQAAFAMTIERLPERKRVALQKWADASHPLAPALRLIESQLSCPPSNDELAESCGQSTDHFARRFKTAMGVTPARYGVERRIAIATQWLLSNQQSIKEISHEAGFSDRFHFSRTFHSLLGVSPAAFRSANSAKLHKQH